MEDHSHSELDISTMTQGNLSLAVPGQQDNRPFQSPLKHGKKTYATGARISHLGNKKMSMDKEDPLPMGKSPRPVEASPRFDIENNNRPMMFKPTQVSYKNARKTQTHVKRAVVELEGDNNNKDSKSSTERSSFREQNFMNARAALGRDEMSSNKGGMSRLDISNISFDTLDQNGKTIVERDSI